MFDKIIEKCGVVAKELIVEKVHSPQTYLGTPSDVRLVAMFGELFGDIQIGHGASRPGQSIQNYELIRWRATELGARGQMNLLYKPLLSARQQQQNQEQPANGTDNSNLSGIVPAEVATQATTSSNRAKKCSNIDCPVHARYSKALSKVWLKCPKTCCICLGRHMFCPHESCRIAMTTHQSNAAARSSSFATTTSFTAPV